MANNKLDHVDIGGKFVGNDDNSTNIYIDNPEAAKEILHDIHIIAIFAENAQAHLSEVAAILASAYDLNDIQEDSGLDNKKLKEKFSNMKCSETYIKDYNEMSAFFHTISGMVNKDSVVGGGKTVRLIISLIQKMYVQLLDKHNNGDEIHNAMLVKLMKKGEPNFFIAANIFIYYIIRECGIFNETK